MLAASASALVYIGTPSPSGDSTGWPSSSPPISVAPCSVKCNSHLIRAPPSTVKWTAKAGPSGCSTRATAPRGATCALGSAASTDVPSSRPKERAASLEASPASWRSASTWVEERSRGESAPRSIRRHLW